MEEGHVGRFWGWGAGKMKTCSELVETASSRKHIYRDTWRQKVQCVAGERRDLA